MMMIYRQQLFFYQFHTSATFQIISIAIYYTHKYINTAIQTLHADRERQLIHKQQHTCTCTTVWSYSATQLFDIEAWNLDSCNIYDVLLMRPLLTGATKRSAFMSVCSSRVVTQQQKATWNDWDARTENVGQSKTQKRDLRLKTKMWQRR